MINIYVYTVYYQYISAFSDNQNQCFFVVSQIDNKLIKKCAHLALIQHVIYSVTGNYQIKVV